MTEKQRQAMYRAIEKTLGTSVICTRCGATLETYADRCSAALDDACPGFQRIDAIRVPIERAAAQSY